MKIRKYTEFIKEELTDTPESYIETALKQIKKKIDKMFEFQEVSYFEPSSEEEGDKEIRKAKLDSKNKSDISFKDLGVRIESSEISKYSAMHDSLTIKFSDDAATYDLYISIDLKDALPKDPNADYSYEDIEKCFMKLKKYNLDTFEVIGQLTKTVEINKIDEDFLIGLKIDMDDKFGDDEKLEIET
jgi:ribosomal protein S21